MLLDWSCLSIWWSALAQPRVHAGMHACLLTSFPSPCPPRSNPLPQAPAAVTDLNAASTYASPVSLRASRARIGAGFWRKMTNTYGAAWELNGVPPAPLHMR